MVTQYFQRNVMVSAPFLLDSIWSHLGDGPLYTPVGDYCGMLIEVGDHPLWVVTFAGWNPGLYKWREEIE